MGYHENTQPIYIIRLSPRPPDAPSYETAAVIPPSTIKLPQVPQMRVRYKFAIYDTYMYIPRTTTTNNNITVLMYQYTFADNASSRFQQQNGKFVEFAVDFCRRGQGQRAKHKGQFRAAMDKLTHLPMLHSRITYSVSLLLLIFLSLKSLGTAPYFYLGRFGCA